MNNGIQSNSRYCICCTYTTPTASHNKEYIAWFQDWPFSVDKSALPWVGCSRQAVHLWCQQVPSKSSHSIGESKRLLQSDSTESHIPDVIERLVKKGSRFSNQSLEISTQLEVWNGGNWHFAQCNAVKSLMPLSDNRIRPESPLLSFQWPYCLKFMNPHSFSMRPNYPFNGRS